jgi:hypothetical protein
MNQHSYLTTKASSSISHIDSDKMDPRRFDSLGHGPGAMKMTKMKYSYTDPQLFTHLKKIFLLYQRLNI